MAPAASATTLALRSNATSVACGFGLGDRALGVRRGAGARRGRLPDAGDRQLGRQLAVHAGLAHQVQQATIQIIDRSDIGEAQQGLEADGAVVLGLGRRQAGSRARLRPDLRCRGSGTGLPAPGPTARRSSPSSRVRSMPSAPCSASTPSTILSEVSVDVGRHVAGCPAPGRSSASSSRPWRRAPGAAPAAGTRSRWPPRPLEQRRDRQLDAEAVGLEEGSSRLSEASAMRTFSKRK